MGSIYSLDGFEPRLIDETYLRERGVAEVSDATLGRLERGSHLFVRQFSLGLPLANTGPVYFVDGDPPGFEIHNYTGRCPANTIELNPAKGSCQVGCLYCLVNDGNHTPPMEVYLNYHKAVRAHLDTYQSSQTYYYLSPKSEAFQPPTLESGVAHSVLREFVLHFRRFPDSGARLFVASKAGIHELLHNHDGDTIIGLLSELSGRVQFNTSIGIVPEQILPFLEPGAATIEARLKAANLCNRNGVFARSVLCQPIFLPSVSEAQLRCYLVAARNHGLENLKPEFLTVCPENLAVLAQIVGHFDPAAEAELYRIYLAPSNEDHKKQRNRTAPLRSLSRKVLLQIQSAAWDLGMTTSICHWVRAELRIPDSIIPIVNENGFQCLGYQTRLWDR